MHAVGARIPADHRRGTAAADAEGMLFYLVAFSLGPVAMAVEARLGKRLGVYRVADTRGNLSQFLGEMILTVALRLDIFALYTHVASRIGLLHFSPRHVGTWVVAFLAMDFMYYVGHRCLHAVGALWALHTVHHQSEEYNFSVGIRGPWLSALQTIPFMLPLALLGLPPSVLVPLYVFHTVYKLVVHTRLLGSFGPLDALLVSPRMHRVHHSARREHQDKNFGGVLSLWDRIFGTYSPDEATEGFGLGHAPDADPLANNLEPFRARLGRPAGGAGETKRPLSQAVAWWCFGGTAAATLAFMVYGPSLPLGYRLVLALPLLGLLRLGNRPAPAEGAARSAGA